jgi:hypothetical protein
MCFDELCHCYDQVLRIGQALAHKFVALSSRSKLCVNLVDHFGTANNCGFNLANFRPAFIQDFYEEVCLDYERSFIGSFAKELFKELRPQQRVFFAISKFEGKVGYSLTQNAKDVEIKDAEIRQEGQIPEFV